MNHHYMKNTKYPSQIFFHPSSVYMKNSAKNYHEFIDAIFHKRAAQIPEQLLLSKREIAAVPQECGLSKNISRTLPLSLTRNSVYAQLQPANVIEKKEIVIRISDVVTKVD